METLNGGLMLMFKKCPKCGKQMIKRMDSSSYICVACLHKEGEGIFNSLIDIMFGGLA